MKPSSLLLLEQAPRFLLCLPNLLIQNFVLLILNACQSLRLPINQLLPRLLLLHKLLLFFVFSKLVHGILLLPVDLNFGHLLGFFDLLLSHVVNQLQVSLLEVITLHSLLLLPVHLSLVLLLDLVIDLPLDQFTLEHIVLQSLDVGHLIIVQLVVDNLLVARLLFVFHQQFLPHFYVIFVHFLPL